MDEHTTPNTPLHDPWLVAVWPGMGNVAVLGGGTLVQGLGAELVDSIPEREFFHVEHVEVKRGIARPGRLPRNLIFEWRDPAQRHDLIVFVGEAQPQSGGSVLCERILDYAESRGVSRVFTFAALGSQASPADDPPVHVAATDPKLLEELTKRGARSLGEGQISGLNGSLIGAAAQRGMPGACLLGEIPFYAVGVPNPRTSLELVRMFERVSGIDVDTTELAEAARAARPRLEAMLEQLASKDDDAPEDEETWKSGGTPDDRESRPEAIDLETRNRIESLFEAARRDRSRAVELKRLLDRRHVFEQYEDRFLDLFRKAD